MKISYKRPQIALLESRLAEIPQFLIVVAGPRQVGKSTMVRQALRGYDSTFAATDEPLDSEFDDPAVDGVTRTLVGAKPTADWIVQQWVRARAKARRMPEGQRYVLAIDEIQKIPRWSEVVKGLWDADRAQDVPLHVVLLGSSPWLLQKGLTESLAGRYEPINLSHWSYSEMQEAFDVSIDEFVYFGGYPGSAPFIRNESRWRQYVRTSLIQPNIDNDILQMTRVDKPSLIKNLFELGCGAYSGQLISLSKLQGQLQDAGNTVTLTHYLNLLSQAGLLTGLQKYAGQEHRKRASPPKMNAHNTALISALGPYTFLEAKSDRSYWGRLVESSVGAHLLNSKGLDYGVYYWRESPLEVDFVLTKGQKLLAIEVKSGAKFVEPKGLVEFTQKFKGATSLVVGERGIALNEFLGKPLETWLA
jgi:uncharacterized protein